MNTSKFIIKVVLLLLLLSCTTEKSKEGYNFSTQEIREQYIGSVGEPIIAGDKIYSKYVDVPQKIGQLIEYIPDYDSSASTGLNNDSIISKPKGNAIANVEATPSSWPQAPQKGMKNDIDGGEVPWSKIKQTANGKIYAVFNGSDFKKDSTKKRNSKNSQSIDSLANSCSDNDLVIAIFE